MKLLAQRAFDHAAMIVWDTAAVLDELLELARAGVHAATEAARR